MLSAKKIKKNKNNGVLVCVTAANQRAAGGFRSSPVSQSVSTGRRRREMVNGSEKMGLSSLPQLADRYAGAPSLFGTPPLSHSVLKETDTGFSSVW